MQRIAFALYLALFAACSAGFGALAARGAIFPVALASPAVQFEGLAVASLFLLWGILQLALAEREAKPQAKEAAPAGETEKSVAELLEGRAARLNALRGRSGGNRGLASGDGAIAPPDSRWN